MHLEKIDIYTPTKHLQDILLSKQKQSKKLCTVDHTYVTRRGGNKYMYTIFLIFLTINIGRKNNKIGYRAWGKSLTIEMGTRNLGRK